MSSFVTKILYEDNHLIVVNKEVGLLVQKDKTNDSTLADAVSSYLKQRYDKKGNVFLGVVHRLDRPTSGLVIFAKTEKALSRMNALFKEEGSVKKTYWAVVDQMPSSNEGELTHYLLKNSTKNKSFATKIEKRGAKKGRLSYKVIAASSSYFLLEIDLKTGRHHQIRAQLAALGIHIKGDLKYGFKRSNTDGGIHLHARKVEFIHPVRKESITIKAPPPADPLWDYFYAIAKEDDESNPFSPLV
ncbi:MAG: RluA family pseudouridine synthase [Sphaerochaetaceae bacterium]